MPYGKVPYRHNPYKYVNKPSFNHPYKRPNFHQIAKKVKEEPLIFVGSTSHLSIFDKKHVNRSNPMYSNCSDEELHNAQRRVDIFKDMVMPKVNLHTFKGMFLLNTEFERGVSMVQLPKKSPFRVNQCDKLFQAMRASREKVCSLTLGTNDIKSFIYNPITKKVFKLRNNFVRKFNKLSPAKKSNLVLRDTKCLTGVVTSHLEDKVEEFLQILISVLGSCGFNHVILSSLLERNWDGVGISNLPFWFAHINAIFYTKLKKLEGKVLNKSKCHIKFHFCNVSDQYFNAEENKKVDQIFRSYEVVGGELTHRNSEAMREIVGRYMAEANRHLSE